MNMAPRESENFPPSSAISASSAVNDFDFQKATSPAQIAAVRELFLEYANSLGFSLCFQGFDQELAVLPGDYAPPEGRLLLATSNSQPTGCVALHKLEPDICEMKRLYVRPDFRGKGLGRELAEKIIAEARQIGYKNLRLDTVEPKMQTAVAMYRQLGFSEIPPYCPNPIDGALYMELQL
jgi:putative acetyltransferase